jgi:CHAT domain-containing protein
VVEALAPGEVHRYRLPLKAGDLLRLVVDQQRIDLIVTLKDPSGATVLQVDRLINDRGLELVLAVAAASGIHTLVIDGAAEGPGRYEARIEALRPASEADRRSAAAYRSFWEADGLRPEETEEAMMRWTAALATWRELEETALEGEVLARMAWQHYNAREEQASADLYRQAADVFARAGNPRWEAISRNGLSANLLPLGESEEAFRQSTAALRLAHQAGDPINQAKALHGLGQALRHQAELQSALDHYRRALALWPQNDRILRPATLHQLGVLQARFLHDERRGRERLLQSRAAWGPEPDQQRLKATTSSQLGRIAYEQGQPAEARRYFEEALQLRGETGRCASAVIRARLALALEAQGARAEADARLAEALEAVGTATCLRSEPTVHLLSGDLAEKRGDHAKALASFRRCDELFARLSDRMGRADSLAGIARAARSLGSLPEAREASRQALGIVEGVRPTVLNEELRTSFFSGAQSWFDTHIDLLLEMDNAEDTEEAWATAERARARALGDLLVEAGTGLRRTAPPGLLERERTLQRQLNDLESQRLKANESKLEKLRPLQAAIDPLVAELEALRGEIRRSSPRYASLIRPEPFSPAEARRELLDDDTVLLEYRLGEAASTVWAVTREGVTAARLPSRRKIEPLALEAAARLRSLEWPGENPPVLCELSRILLAPVAASLGHRRLAVVADGALEILPFAALPVPTDPVACARASFLGDTHEIVSLPSAAALLMQRRLLAGRPPAPGWLAVVDPIQEPGRALPGAAAEAAAIQTGLPAGKVYKATGPAASRNTVRSGALRDFRIVHFATHGILNTEQPLLSSLALSGANLPAHEIYGLDLPAELVVLSACDTGLGREVPGEGLVSGLPRAFLYAGAARVLVTLWPVEDRSTRDLLIAFYRGLLGQGLPPAQALQEAQRKLRRAGRRPYQWAGFVLLGDWRPLPPFIP